MVNNVMRILAALLAMAALSGCTVYGMPYPVTQEVYEPVPYPTYHLKCIEEMRYGQIVKRCWYAYY